MASVDPVQSQLANLFLQTLDVKAETRRTATNSLMDGERAPGFTMNLLRLAGNAAFDTKVRLLAATHFKNVVKRNWNEPEPAVISVDDRATIKAHLVGLMCSVPPLVQRQLSESLSIISKRDFPAQWPTLMGDLVAGLGSPDVNTVVGVLETAASIFERFRDAPNTDPVRLELRYCLDHFTAPMMATLVSLVKRLEDGTAAGEGRVSLAPVLQAIRLVVSIYTSLSWLELPDVFEEKMAEWMTLFRKFLTYSNPALEAAPEDMEEGPVEALQAAVLDVVGVLADKYDEEFEAFFPTFAGDVWALLSGASSARIMAESMDPLVIKAVRFLTASVNSSVHAAFFKGPGLLQALCEKVVVPNIRLRASDLEVFEDNPIEFIRRDIEGSDTDTRRRVSTDLVRALCKQFEEEASTVVLGYVASMLAEYEARKAANFLEKDAAIALLIAAAVKTQVTSLGVTGMNPRVDLGGYLTAHILPELSVAVSPAVDPSNPAAGAGAAAYAAAAVNELPIAKAAALKFITTFRAQFSREQLVALLPMVVPFAGANSFVVHTYAANCFERVLTIKDKKQESMTVVSVSNRLAVEDVTPHLPVLFTGLFALMTRADYPENEYLMKALMRVVAFSGPAVAEYAPQVITGLTGILGRVCANPTNPVFNHFLFETIACLMRDTCNANPAAVPEFERMLFPPFEHVLSADVAEFLPYVFQLMAELLELRPAPAPGEHALTAAYQSLLPPLLNAEIWLRPGNVPALAMLMQAYLRRGAAFLAEKGQLVPLLGVWQNLLNTKNQEEFSFDILDALFEGGTLESFSGYMGTITRFLCERLQTSKSAKIARAFSHSMAVFVGFHGAGVLEASLNALTPGLFWQILESVILTQANSIPQREARVETAVGLTRLLAELPTLATDPARAATLNTLITTIVELCEPLRSAYAVGVVGGSGSGFVEERDTGDMVEEAVSAEYSAAFSKLLFAQEKARNVFKPRVPDVKVYLGQTLVALSAAAPGRLPALITASPASATLQRYIAAAGGGLM